MRKNRDEFINRMVNKHNKRIQAAKQRAQSRKIRMTLNNYIYR